jgi:N12 class adenine-specific DNA methylase
LKAIYGMLEAALLWYKTFRKDLEDIGFIFNAYDPCVANKKVQGSQQTILFHVDDLKSSHKMKSVNDQFEKWLYKKYGKHGKVTTTCGKVHNYLGMELDYCKQGE